MSESELLSFLSFCFSVYANVRSSYLSWNYSPLFHLHISHKLSSGENLGTLAGFRNKALNVSENTFVLHLHLPVGKHRDSNAFLPMFRSISYEYTTLNLHRALMDTDYCYKRWLLLWLFVGFLFQFTSAYHSNWFGLFQFNERILWFEWIYSPLKWDPFAATCSLDKKSAFLFVFDSNYTGRGYCQEEAQWCFSFPLLWSVTTFLTVFTGVLTSLHPAISE